MSNAGRLLKSYLGGCQRKGKNRAQRQLHDGGGGGSRI